MAIPSLFAAFPSLKSKLAFEPLGRSTPIERLAELGARLGLASLYVKRDDLAAEPYGGNKIRKLAFVLADARRRGCRRVLTFGGYGSNHALATAVYANQLGMRAVLLLLPEPNDAHVRHNLLAAKSFGAELRITSPETIDRLVRQTKASPLIDDTTYVIPPGGTCFLGNVGYVDAAFELREQIESGQMSEPDVLWVAAGTLGTAVGLAVGLRAAGLRTRVRAVRTSSLRYVSERAWSHQFAETVSSLRDLSSAFPQLVFDPASHLLEHGYVGRGYALPTVRGRRAADLVLEAEGLTLDSTYTAKTMAALMGSAQRLHDKVVLFWHTYDARTLDVRGLGPSQLPEVFRGYWPSAR
jgi:1-aminocyclopropane-1-carboxylate deaminase/D-cysteine desulfhydrase-like pyridoxal-dependent ACC family enzyme